MTTRLPILAALGLALVLALAGCGGFRVVIEPVPAEEGLVETVVLEEGGGRSMPKVALVDVSGLMLNARRGGLITEGDNPVSLLCEALAKAEEDRQVRAVVLRINSRGGTVTASELMWHEVRSFRDRSGIPVVAMLMDVAASGGYYLACAADEIVVRPSTVTGSIGVIMQLVNVSDGLSRIGVHPEAITSGPNKGAGSPLEPLTDEHRRLLQEMVDLYYADFVDVVRSGRPGLDPADLPWVADGRVMTGRQAVEVGLADEVGDLRDAFAAACRLAGITRAKLVRYHPPGEHIGSAYAQAPSTGTEVNLLQLNVGGLGDALDPGFYYLWEPGSM